MDSMDKVRFCKAGDSRDNSTLEIAVVTARHLVNVRYSIEVTDADSLVLDTVTNVNLVVPQQYLAPFKRVIKKEFVSVV